MTRSRTLIWLHRIGYFTTAIVAAELLGLMVLSLYFWNEDRKHLAVAMELTRTHDGPIVVKGSRSYRPDDLDLLATLPPLQMNSLHFIALPSLRDSWFALALTVPAHGDRARGVVNIFAHPDGPQEELIMVKTISFSMAKSSASRLILDVEAMTENWKGERVGCLDGTGVAFELWTRKGVTSGNGNAACSDHYGALSELVRKSVQHLIPPAERPIGSDWRPAR
ncbi:hypothetical protein HRJ34_03550 [Rhizorhabdus wittichii]|uniref:Uncharacterized protein n=1 Tax=Rhizorhabdus wittichii TaxID=160791 RepID=A0A975D493_9SPHN|nr:hypothetical protein [Rhizorhabdus wittichii]QTH22611.1 hypothetical protein HRJ34_03550 [Rhizorhabdus wittichii]